MGNALPALPDFYAQMHNVALPSRPLAGVLFGAAGTIWWFLASVLSILIAPEEPAFPTSFWLGWLLIAASAAGWGAALGHPIARHAHRSTSLTGMILSATAGMGTLALAGLTALLLALGLSALVVGTAPVSTALRAAAAQPEQLLLPTISLLLIAAPFGGAAGVALRAMAHPASPPNGSTRHPPR